MRVRVQSERELSTCHVAMRFEHVERDSGCKNQKNRPGIRYISVSLPTLIRHEDSGWPTLRFFRVGTFFRFTAHRSSPTCGPRPIEVRIKQNQTEGDCQSGTDVREGNPGATVPKSAPLPPPGVIRVNSYSIMPRMSPDVCLLLDI